MCQRQCVRDNKSLLWSHGNDCSTVWLQAFWATAEMQISISFDIHFNLHQY